MDPCRRRQRHLHRRFGERHLQGRELLSRGLAELIVNSFDDYRRRFDSTTLRARPRFEGRDWRAFHRDIVERIDVYEATVAGVVEEARQAFGERLLDRAVWASAKGHFSELVAARPAPEIGATYFNSVTRRVFGTVGVDDDIELGLPHRAPESGGPKHGQKELIATHRIAGDPANLFRALLRDRRFQATWRDLHGDVLLGTAALQAALDKANVDEGCVEVLVPTFYRGQGAYIIGRITGGDEPIPLVLAIHHDRRGLSLGAVLVDPDDVSVLFSYTHSEFVVRTPNPRSMVQFIRTLIPHRRPAELYTALGYRKHGKTEMYRDLALCLEQTDDDFTRAPGVPGLVMSVFTLEAYDMVFKVIRDHFPPQKSVTPEVVRAKYAVVSRHDRAGRLVDAQEFKGLTLPSSRFDASLLAELASEAARTVSVREDVVRFDRVYVERRVVPLDVYIRDRDAAAAEAAMIDYGSAIKNLAATNIFPGDMLIKNFGVTRQGRVVFYDYDELSLLTDCRFRALPPAEHPEDDLAEVPWYGVGEGDIFPEEFRAFLGVSPELRAVFEEHHDDLYGVEFWKRIQARIQGGEAIEIFPYRRQAALRAGS